MRWLFVLVCICLAAAGTPSVAKDAKPNPRPPAAAGAPIETPGTSNGPIEITADESLEWYQDKHLYVARGNAKAVRGSMTVEADLLTAHERDKDKQPEGKAPAAEDKAKTPAAAPVGGNIDVLTAEGNVRITDPRQQVFGERAVYDLDSRTAKVTGKNLKYLTAKDVVTARDSLEYYEEKNMAVARGNAKALHEERHVEADVLTARFAQSPAGQMEMVDMTAEGHVTVITGNDISRGDHAVYDIKRNVAVMTGHVRVTRGETQLAGDRAEVDFTKGESRLINQGHGRVRALLVPKNVKETSAKTETKAPEKSKVDAGSKLGHKTD
ncbi:MAG: LptA/OstA family protein [Alphaproteobacteria bacterium]|nr:LptA/OstA family protein [Alphaproteobacteria bacterium]